MQHRSLAEIIHEFFEDHPDIKKIVWDGLELSVYGSGPDATGCGASEYLSGTQIKQDIEDLEEVLEDSDPVIFERLELQVDTFDDEEP